MEQSARMRVCIRIVETWSAVARAKKIRVAEATRIETGG
jgi:hypothetical protein